MEAQILIVDDDRRIAGIASRFIQEIKPAWSPIMAHSCAEARRIFRNELPQAAILDVELPDGNGFELLSELRALDPAIPVVVMSGSDPELIKSLSAKEQPYPFVEKPFSITILIDTLERELQAAYLISPQNSRRPRLDN